MPYGTVNADVIQSSVSGVSLGAGNASIMKNRIINGAMVVNQYSANSVNVTTGNTALVCDRFKITNTTDGTLNVQQSTVAPAGFNNSTLITATVIDSSIGATQYAQIEQRIEGYNVADLNFGTSNAKTVTLSFWVNCSVTGTYCVTIANGAGNRSYVSQYTISSANTWQQVTVTVVGDTAGTWLTTNGKGLVVTFALAVGSTYQQAAGSWGTTSFAIGTSSQTNFVNNLNATFYITGVQLEVGTSATGFEYRQYQQELALCQRYFYMVTSGDGLPIMMGCYYSSTQIRGMLSFPVTMRTAPSLYSSSGSNYYLFESTLGDNFNSFTIYKPNINNSVLYNSTESSGTTGVAATVVTANASAYVGFSAEL